MAKITNKTSNSNMDENLLSTNRTWIDFLDKESLSNFPEKDNWRQRLIHTMLKWSEDCKSLEVMQFCLAYKVPRRTLMDWVERYEDVRRAYEDMKLAIGSHRRVGAMNKKLDGAYAYKDMHAYDPEWHAINKYHSDMKKEEEKQAHTFIISDAKPRIVSKEEMINKGKEEE